MAEDALSAVVEKIIEKVKEIPVYVDRIETKEVPVYVEKVVVQVSFVHNLKCFHLYCAELCVETLHHTVRTVWVMYVLDITWVTYGLKMTYVSGESEQEVPVNVEVIVERIIEKFIEVPVEKIIERIVEVCASACIHSLVYARPLICQIYME